MAGLLEIKIRRKRVKQRSETRRKKKEKKNGRIEAVAGTMKSRGKQKHKSRAKQT